MWEVLLGQAGQSQVLSLELWVQLQELWVQLVAHKWVVQLWVLLWVQWAQPQVLLLLLWVV